MRFHQLVGQSPAIVRVTRGTKRVEVGDFAIEAIAGSFVILPENLPMTIENRPEEGGLYEASALTFDRAIFEQSYQALNLADRGTQLRPVKATGASRGLEESFDQVRSAIAGQAEIPVRIFELRCQELVTWLAESGAVLGPARPATLSDRVRSIITSNIARPWTAGDIAACLSMSEPTLRRKLAGEKASFLTLLADARMIRGLGLLQTTNWTIAAIALEVGYESPSRFAVRFRDRFGLPPGKLRLPDVIVDRNGTDNDRKRRAS